MLDKKEIIDKRTIDESAKPILEKAMDENLETVWDRLEAQQPQCGYGQLGLCCNRCAMGPCRIDPFEKTGPKRGVCGADASLISARNLLDDLLVGAAAHSDHGREIIEVLLKTSRGQAQGYEITDTEKLKTLAEEFDIDTSKSDNEIAEELALKLFEEFGTIKNSITFALKRAPEKNIELWKKLNIFPRSVDREIVEAAHRIHMGVDSSYDNVLIHALRTSLSDGWGGSMMATEISDVLFGTPTPCTSYVNLGCIKEDHINILLHGHNPILSEMLVKAAQEDEIKEMALKVGSQGLNLLGMCCTGNEVLMRRGIPIAGNMLLQELAIATGAIELMLIDYQCIFPSIAKTAKCYHTIVVSTSEKARFSDAKHVEFHPDHALDIARDIIRLAINNFKNRNPNRVKIPKEPMKMMAGFSVEAIKKALGGSLTPLLEAIKSGKIKGVVGIVGCNNPKITHDFGHVNLTKELIKNDILVAETGCAAIACAKAGLLLPEAADMAGDGLKEIANALGIPPVLHMGSCVDCSRILVLAGLLAKELGVSISDLPIGGAAPEWYSQKAVSIGSYFVASGVTTVLGLPLKIYGNKEVLELLTNGLKDIIDARFIIEPDPFIAADMLIKHIEDRRKRLGI